MATDGPTPPPCDSEIFERGRGVCTVYGASNAVERWVKSIAKKADARVDWQYTGGVANILHLGTPQKRERVIEVIHALKDELDGRIMEIGEPNPLYRKGVEKAPPGVLAIDPNLSP